MASGATHNPNVQTLVNLEPLPRALVSFTTVAIMVDQATSSLNGDRIRSYTSSVDVQNDVTAGFLSASVGQGLTDAFAQANTPSVIKAIRVNTVGGETYDAVPLAAADLVDSDYYAVVIEPRTDTEILAIPAAVESYPRSLQTFVQSDDADWLTAGYPAGLAALEGRERTSVMFHDTDSEWLDLCYAAQFFTFDPDQTSAPAPYQQISEVLDLATAITPAQRLAALGNDANLMLDFYGFNKIMGNGTTTNARQPNEIVTADWFKATTEQGFATLLVQAAARGDKISVDPIGQARLATVITDTFDRGVEIGHFVDGQIALTNEPITAADITAERVRFSVRAQTQTAVVEVQLTADLSRNPVIA